MLPDELFREQAEKRVKLGLILGEVIKQRGMRAEAAKVREAIEDIAATYESPAEVISWYYSNKDQLDAVESAVLEDQVFEVIFEQATLTERTVSYEELTRPKAPGADGEESAEKDKKASKKSSKKAAESADDKLEGPAD
jgi:trigger factor